VRELAAAVPCDIHLVHLYSPVREHERLGLDPPVAFEVDPEVVEILSRELRGHVQRALGRTDLPLRIRPSWRSEDDPLAWEAESEDADLLVVGTRQGRTSHALATVRGARVPVACVPRPLVAEQPLPLSPIRSVLVTTDFSPLGNAAVAQAYRLLARGGGDVTLAYVDAGNALTLDPDRSNELETTLLGIVPPSVNAHAIHTRTFVTADPSPGEAIVKAIRRLAPDVVVMASHGRSGIGRALHGSVTEHVVRHSPKPVLVVPVASVVQDP